MLLEVLNNAYLFEEIFPYVQKHASGNDEYSRQYKWPDRDQNNSYKVINNVSFYTGGYLVFEIEKNCL